jgi:hypothetical protein
MVLQHRLVCYPNAGWYATQRLVHYSSESVELIMMYGFVKFNKTMVEVSESTKVVMIIMPRGIPSSLRGSVKFFESDSM